MSPTSCPTLRKFYGTVIYEHYAKAGPRGINGYPMFMSCLILHREDWKIIREAAAREAERRKNDDILGGI